MAKRAGFPQNFYVGGYDISGDVGAVNTIGTKRATQDVTGIDKSAIERIHGQVGGELSFATWFNDATDQVHDALSTLPTADVHVMNTLGLVLGDPVAALIAKQIDYDWARASDGSLAGTVQALSAAGQPLEWGVLLTAGGKRTDASPTDGAALDDNGAASAEGGIGWLQFFSADGANAEVLIEDSATQGGAYTTVIAFTAVATPWNPTAERKEMTGEVLRWLRAATVASSANVVFAVAFRRGTTVDDNDLS